MSQDRLDLRIETGRDSNTFSLDYFERLFGIKLFLDLHVRVEPGWRSRPAFLDALDWRTNAGSEES